MKAAGSLVLAAALLAAPAFSDEAKTSPTVAREAAEANQKTPAGRRYDSALASSLDAWLARAIERCGKGVAPEDAVSFEVFVRISDAGGAEEVVVSPETAVSRCAGREFLDAKYPHPPQEGWWVRVPIALR